MIKILRWWDNSECRLLTTNKCKDDLWWLILRCNLKWWCKDNKFLSLKINSKELLKFKAILNKWTPNIMECTCRVKILKDSFQWFKLKQIDTGRWEKARWTCKLNNNTLFKCKVKFSILKLKWECTASLIKASIKLLPWPKACQILKPRIQMDLARWILFTWKIRMIKIRWWCSNKCKTWEFSLKSRWSFKCLQLISNKLFLKQLH